jgi:hypothetical protein
MLENQQTYPIGVKVHVSFIIYSDSDNIFLKACPFPLWRWLSLTAFVYFQGWLPDLRFATRRSLNDACTDIGNQLGKVYESTEVILFCCIICFS